jgi:hypothetical protein
VTVATRDFVRGRFGDQPVFSRYALGDGPDWMQDYGGDAISPHMPLGLEDLDDVAEPVVATPSGGGSGVAVSVGGTMPKSSLFRAVPSLATITSGVARPVGSSGGIAQPSGSSGGAVARPVSADGSVNGDKGFFAEVINPEHPQYQAARAGLATSTPEQQAAFARNIEEGIRQAVTGQTSTSWLSSLLGAGIGGPGLGTGSLPGLLGRRAEQLFGAAGLPPGAVWDQGLLRPTNYVNDPAWMSLANDVDRVGRSTVERLLGATQPQLDGIRRLLEHRANQVQATSEHQAATRMDNTVRQILELLQTIAIRTGARTPLDFAVQSWAGSGGAAWRRY